MTSQVLPTGSDGRPEFALAGNTPLAGKVAIVTGAGRYLGIGRAAALVLSRLGADVAVTGTGRDPSRYPDEEKAIGWHDIESVADEIRSLGRKALPLVSDASDSSAVDAMVERVVGELGRVDILVCNAAAPMGEDRVPLLEVDRDVFKRVVDVKVLGSFYAAQAVGNRLKRQNQGGSIVFISSISGKRGQANTAAYNAANFAVNGMMQSTAKELAPMGINVNAVCPGLIPTSRWDGVDWTARLGQVPAGRGGTYEEVGELIAFLCTPAAAYINGQAINIDGGMVTEH